MGERVGEAGQVGQVGQVAEEGQDGQVGEVEQAGQSVEPEAPEPDAQAADAREDTEPEVQRKPPGSPAPEIPAPETLNLASVIPELEPLEPSPLSSARGAELKSILEALIFASPDPLTPKAIYKLLDNEPEEDVRAALLDLKQDYERPSGLQLVEVAGGFQIVTRSDLHEWVRRLFHERSSQKLSVQALETLAVIAYRQPVTAAEITDIRGVNTSGVLNTLLERHLIKIVGRKQVVGRPFMYATTKEFLIRFGLNDLTDLPKVEDMAEALGIEHPLLVEQSTQEELLPLEEPEAEVAAIAAPVGADLNEPSASTTSTIEGGVNVDSSTEEPPPPSEDGAPSAPEAASVPAGPVDHDDPDGSTH